jgi:CubicO group peptidase (beta-lactamase class C family)
MALSAQRLTAFDRFLEEKYLGPGKIPGAVTIVAHRGEVVHCRALGLADVERGTPMCEDTIFRLYSMTKPITSIAFMMLVESGAVALHQPVQDLIPQWKNLAPRGDQSCRVARAHRPMLIMDLLRHTAGLAYGFGLSSGIDTSYRGRNGEASARSMDEVVDQLAQMPLEFRPGEAWNYSIATDIAGYLIEKLTGAPLAEFFRRRIFEPLKMRDTDFFVPANKRTRFAACYATPPAMTLLDDPISSAYLEMPSVCSGGGGLVSTAPDYLRLCRMLLNGGEYDGVRVLRPETIAAMTTNQLPGGADLPSISRAMFTDPGYRAVGFGFGLAVTIDSARATVAASTGDFSWGGAASTYFWIDPREDLIVVFMTQVAPSTAYPLRRDLREWVYGAIIDRKRSGC